VFRELLQNSDDAQSSAVELYFETGEYLRRKSNKDTIQPEDNAQFPNLKATQVRFDIIVLLYSFISHHRLLSGPSGMMGGHFATRTGVGLGKSVRSARLQGCGNRCSCLTAEGNPDEEKIGAFGVGMFVLCNQFTS
jgi:hypothetical protein